MRQQDIKKKYGVVESFSWRVIGILSLLFIITCWWSYITNNLNKELLALRSNNDLVLSVSEEFKRMDRNSFLWLKSFNVDDKNKYEIGLLDIDDKFKLIDYSKLGGVDIQAVLDKNKEYWDLLTSQLLQINFLSLNSNNLFYEFNRLALLNAESAEITSKIVMLSELHRQVKNVKSLDVISAIKRDVVLIVQSMPLLEAVAYDYIDVIDDIDTAKGRLDRSIREFQSSRYEDNFDILSLLNLLRLGMFAEEKRILKHLDLYLYILTFVVVVVVILVVLLVKKFREIEESNKKVIVKNYKLLNDELLLCDHKQESKTKFLSVVSCEARTTLDAVLGLTRTAQKSCTNSSQLSKLNEVVDSSQKLYSLLDDVLEFIDVELALVTLQSESFSLSSIFDTLTDRYQSLARHKSIVFETDIPSSLNSVFIGDQYKIYKIFDFILSNSLAFTNSGHIILSVGDSADSLMPSLRRINISIEDTGINLTNEEAEELFNPYSSVLFDSSRKSGGFGFRLSSAASFIRMMDGEIDIECKSDRGLIFNFYLLLQNTDQSQSPEPSDTLINTKTI